MAGIPVFNLAGTAVANATLNTVTWPTHAANDVALLIVQTDAEASSLVTAAGFVEVTGSPQTTGTAAATNAVALQVFWKRATGAAEANVTLADAGDHTFAQILTFTNVKTSGNPWNLTAGNVKAAASTNVQVTGFTTTTADCLIVAVIAGSVDTATAQASAWTDANLATPATAEMADVADATGGGGSLSTGGGGLKLKGATGTVVVTVATASKNAYLLIALAPIEPTGTGSVALAKPTLSGTGKQTHTGTGSLALAKPTLAGTGKQTHVGTGSIALAKPVLAGVGLRGEIGTGGVALAKPTLAGAGSILFTGTGTLSLARPTLAGTGTKTFVLEGVTYRDISTEVLGFVTVYLFKDNGDDTVTFVGAQISDGTTGVYRFTTIADGAAQYFVVGFRNGTPNTFDVSDRTLQPL
jgi:hypothetical protein